MPNDIQSWLNKFYFTEDIADWEYATGTVATSGDNTIVAAPGVGKAIIVSLLSIQNESSSSNTYIIKDGTSSPKMRIHTSAEAQGVWNDLSPGHYLILSENNALVLNLSDANATGYTFRYIVIDV